MFLFLPIPGLRTLPFLGVKFFIPIGVERVFVAIKNLALVVLPTIPVFRSAALDRTGEGVLVFLPAGQEKPILVTNFRVGPAAVFDDLVGHPVDILLGFEGAGEV